jgi:hypothetical protein
MTTARAFASAMVVGCTCATLAGAARVAAAQSAQPGWTYASRITVDSGGGHVTELTTRFRISGDRVRSESTIGGATGAAIAGMYSVINRRDSTMTMVMPKQMMATTMSMGAQFPAGSPTLRMGATHVTASRIDTLGAGETINGYETQRLHTTTSGTSDFSVGSQMCSRSFDVVTDIWYAPKLDMQSAATALADGIAGAGIPTMTDGVRTGATAPAAPLGAPLRSIMRSTSRDARGKVMTVTTTMEITELNHDPIDDAEFAVPAGFKVMDMTKLMAEAGRQVASSAVADVNERLLKTMCGTP